MILVTGAAGFIGSNLCMALIAKGEKVIGVDCFLDNYPRWIKEKNLAGIMNHPSFIFLEENILNPDISKLIQGLNITHVVHLADIPGVASCNEENFEFYIQNNVVATQRLLEAVKNKGITKFIYSSSSSVYGKYLGVPMAETNHTNPISLYGATKLTGENICNYYGAAYGIKIVNLRFFTVYGPRQRPDMAFHKFIKANLIGEQINVYGDGSQTRDFVYIDDVTDAILSAMELEDKNLILNIAAGTNISVNHSLEIIQLLTKKKSRINYINQPFSEQKDTYASIIETENTLKFKPSTDFVEGLNRQIQYIKLLYRL